MDRLQTSAWRLGVSILLAHACIAAQHRYAASGLVLSVDAPHQTIVISHGSIPGYMQAMVMPFHVREQKTLETLHRGDSVSFALVVDRDASWIEDVHVVEFDSAERDPAQASRLKLLGSLMDKGTALTPGRKVPDFTLIDQSSHPVTLSQFRGKVVALNFVYTRCPLPDYCFRLSNNFGRLQARFPQSRDLVLLTITFDPANDRPDVLERYGKVWKAVPGFWYFLTGSDSEIHRVCAMFGVASWPDEGLLIHSLHTAIIDRQGRLVANLEGNQYTAQQLGDLVESVIQRN